MHLDCFFLGFAWERAQPQQLMSQSETTSCVCHSEECAVCQRAKHFVSVLQATIIECVASLQGMHGRRCGGSSYVLLILASPTFSSNAYHLIASSDLCDMRTRSFVSICPNPRAPCLSQIRCRQHGDPHDRCGGFGRAKRGRSSSLRGARTVALGHQLPRHVYPEGVPLAAIADNLEQSFFDGGNR